MRVWRSLSSCVCIFILIFCIAGEQIIFAASSPWSQTDWSGSSYLSASSVVPAANQITLTQTSNWYDTSWKYRESVAVTNNLGSSMTDFQIPIVLDTASLISASKMNANCTDLRVTDATGSAIPYWIATAPTADTCGTNGSSTTKIWVKTPSIAASGSTLYVYYGNSSAASQSNGGNVFPVFADFTSASSTPSGWSATVIGSTGSVTVGSGVLSVTNTDGVDVWDATYGATHAFRDAAVSGSFVAETLITSQTDTTPPISTWAKSGISIQNARSSGGGNGHAFIITTPGNGVRFQYQSTSGELCTNGSCPTVISPNVNEPVVGGSYSYPTLLKLVKDGSNNVSGYNYDTAQKKWIKEGNTFAPWGVATDQYISLFTTAHIETGRHDTVTATFAFFYTRSYVDQTKEPTVGTPASEQTAYGTSGTLTSSIFDTGQTSNFGTLTFSADTPATTSATVKVRTSSSADPTMANAADFTSCTSVSSGADISSNPCVKDGDRFVQYQVTLTSSDGFTTPTFKTVSISFEPVPTSGSPNTAAPTPAPNSCSLQAPTGIPSIYELAPMKESMTLYFTPVSGSDRYFIRYGTTALADQYGADFIHTDQSGAVSYVVDHLASGTTYYFSVRGGNGCATGEWSPVVSRQTGVLSIPFLPIKTDVLGEAIEKMKDMTIVSSDLTENPSSVCSHVVSPGETVWSIAKNILYDATRFSDIKTLNKMTTNTLRVGQELKLPCDEKLETLKKAKKEVEQTGSILDVKVVTTDNKPVEGATVTLHSTVQTATTNKDGVAHFEQVETGDHTVFLSYNGYEGEQKLNVEEGKKSQTLTLQVQMTNSFSSLLVKIVIGVLSGIVLILGFILWKKRHVIFAKG